MIENNVVDMITESGKEVYHHIVIAGESHLMDTLSGFAEMVEQMPGQVRIIVWLNEFFGKIEADGKPFEEMNSILKTRIGFMASCGFQEYRVTFGADIEKMLDSKLTFDEVKRLGGILHHG